MNPASFLLRVRFCYVYGFAMCMDVYGFVTCSVLLCIRFCYVYSKRFDVILHNFYTNLETQNIWGNVKPQVNFQKQ